MPAVSDSSTKDIDESVVQSSAAYVLFYRRRHCQYSGAAAFIPTGLDAESRNRSEQNGVVPEAAEAGIVANMSARPRENTGSQGRGRGDVIGPREFGGAADLELLAGDDEDSSPARAYEPSPPTAYGPHYEGPRAYEPSPPTAYVPHHEGASGLDSQEC